MTQENDGPILPRNATQSARDAGFMAWWRDNAPFMLFGEARDAYDKAQSQKALDAAKRARDGWRNIEA